MRQNRRALPILLGILCLFGCGGKGKEETNAAFIQSVSRGDTAQARTLLEQGADVESRHATDHRTGLMLAALKGQEEMVALLLEKGADAKATDKDGMTALHWGAFGGRASVIKRLLEKGADAKAKDQKGQTPLDWGRDHPEVVAALKKSLGAAP